MSKPQYNKALIIDFWCIRWPLAKLMYHYPMSDCPKIFFKTKLKGRWFDENCAKVLVLRFSHQKQFAKNFVTYISVVRCDLLGEGDVWGLWPQKWFLEVLSNFFSFNNHPQALRWSLRYRLGVLRFWWFPGIFVILRKILQANNKILQAFTGIFVNLTS